MPAAVKAQAEYGDEIQVILVESQGASEEDMLAFALKHKWLGGSAIWTTERPFSTGGNGLPMYALLGPDGQVVMAGNSASDHGKIEEALATLLDDGSSAPKGTPAEAAKIYLELDRGAYAKAIAEAQKLAVKAGAKEPAVAKAAQDAEKAAAARLDGEIARIRALAAQGLLVAAQARSERLANGVEGHAEFAAKAAELNALFTGEEAKRELAADKALAKLSLEAFASGAKDDKAAKKLRKFAEANAGTKAAARAEKLAELMSRAMALPA